MLQVINCSYMILGIVLCGLKEVSSERLDMICGLFLDS